MPKILEQEALFLAQNIDGLEGEKKASALDILTRYKQQQEDEGLPDFPTQESERRNREIEFREMFKSPEAIKYEPAQFSVNPILDKQQHANMALLARAYQKEPLEIAERYDFFLNDYASQRFSKKEIDTAGFYAEARKMIERDEKRENAFLEGSRAALRGENVISSLQGWQGKNLDMMEDSSQFTQGFLRAQEKAGDMIPLADKMLKLIESGTGKSNSTRVFDAEAAKELDDMTAELATMKPRERKEVYASIAARVEAAGYDQKGFWSQMLGQIDQGLFRMSQTVPQGMGSVLGTIGDNLGSIFDNVKDAALTMQAGGGIAFVASVAGYRGLPKALCYGPGKAALIHFAEVLHLDLAAQGIGVWVINPGFVATQLTAQNDFAMPALLTPEQAASAAVDGFRKANFEIHFPKRFTMVMKLLAHLPYRWYFPLVRRFTGV